MPAIALVRKPLEDFSFDLVLVLVVDGVIAELEIGVISAGVELELDADGLFDVIGRSTFVQNCCAVLREVLVIQVALNDAALPTES
jgi:hypothetical protein